MIILNYKDFCENHQMDELTHYHQRIAHLINSTPGMSQSELARRLGISQQNVNYLASHAKGSTHNSKIAAIFGVNPVWLETGKGPKVVSGQQQSGMYSCPIVFWDDIERGIRGQCEILEYTSVETTFGTQLICAKYSGQSMSPPITNGSYIVIDYSDDAIKQCLHRAGSGSFNLAVIQKGTEIVLTNLIKEGSRLTLNTTQMPPVQEKFDLNNDKVLGQVVHSFINFRR